MFVSSDVDSDSQVRMKKPGQARKNEKKMLKAVFEEALK
jgi:hypothetical protein